MAALSGPRATPLRASQGALSVDLYLLMAASTVIHQGSLVALNATGLAKPAGGAVATERVAGVAQEAKTSAASGATYVRVKRGVAKLANLAGDLVVQANLLADCFADDDQTVRATSNTNTRSRAGKVIQIEADGVWVETY
jgi:hypothetical protein